MNLPRRSVGEIFQYFVEIRASVCFSAIFYRGAYVLQKLRIIFFLEESKFYSINLSRCIISQLNAHVFKPYIIIRVERNIFCRTLGVWKRSTIYTQRNNLPLHTSLELYGPNDSDGYIQIIRKSISRK